MNEVEYIDAYVITPDGTMMTSTEYEAQERSKEKNRKKEYEEDEQDDQDFTCWVKTGSTYTASKGSTIEKSIQSGFYSVFSANQQIHLSRYQINTDELYLLPGDEDSKVVNEITEFWKKRELFKEHNIVHKRGILLAGPPGTGKSSLVNIISKNVVSNGGVVFYIDSPDELGLFLTMVHSQLRFIEEDRPIVVVLEDIDKFTERFESLISNFLDGQDQIDHCVVLATTNRLHELNDLMLRPSRFDWVIEIGNPKEEVRKFFFKQKGITEKEELQEWVKKTDGLSLADLKEVFIGVKLLDYSIDDVLLKLKGQKDMIQNTTYQTKRKKVGF